MPIGGAGLGLKNLVKSIEPTSSQTMTSWRKLSEFRNTESSSLSVFKNLEARNNRARDSSREPYFFAGKNSGDTFYTSRV